MESLMAIHFDDDETDELSQLLKDPRRDTRRDIWLWLWLQNVERADLDPTTCNGESMRSAIAQYLKRRTDLLGEINWRKDQFMVPEDILKWIGGNERQYLWLLSRIEDITDKKRLTGPKQLVHLTGRNHILALLDIWEIDIAEKADEIERLHEEWLRQKASDREFVWFEDKKEGVQRCQCAWEWLEKNHSPLSRRQLPISNHQELLIFFDKENLAPYMQKTIIQQIRRKWSRKQFDERTADKKQVNVMLSNSVIKQLDQLAKKHELKRAQVLELLISMETKQDMMTKDYLHDGNIKTT
jgi:hypothetical protein